MKRFLALGSSDQALPVTARRAKRENEGLGEDPPGSTITYLQVLRTWMFSQGRYEAMPCLVEQ
jgi:hypothetical protein